MYKPVFTLLFIISSLIACAQDTASTGKGSFYLTAGVGYALPQTSYVTYGNNNFKVKRGDFSTGINETIGGGYLFTPHIGVEVNAALFSGGKKYVNGTYNSLSGYSSYDQYNNNLQALCLVMPGVVLQTSGNRWGVYSRLAVVLPVIDKNSYSGDSPGLALESGKTINRFTLGFSGAAGLRYKMGSRLQIWAEVGFLSLMPYVKTDAPEYGSSYSFSKSGSLGINASGNLTHTTAFNNEGLQGGISYGLGHKYMALDKLTATGSRFYCKGGLGYAFVMPSPGNMVYSGSDVYNYTGTGYNSGTFSHKPASFSAGLSGTVGAGYMLGRHIGAELDGSIGIANKKYNLTQEIYGSSSYSYYGITTYARLPVLLQPFLVLQTGGSIINLYCRTGIVLPVNNKVMISESDNSYPANVVLSEQLTTRFTIGYTGAAGIAYTLTRHMALWTEVNLLSFSPLVKEAKVLSSTQAVQNTNYTKSGGTNSSPGLGTQYSYPEPSYQLPYNNIGIQAGVSFRL